MDPAISQPPSGLAGILAESERIGFNLASTAETGALLRALAASKPGGRLLELGTGTGAGTAWLLSGMDGSARLDTVENDDAVQAIARRHLGADGRVTFHTADGGAFLEQAGEARFDLIYADAWPGKYTHLDWALRALRIGGIYVVDDLLPQPNWPDNHAARVPPFIGELERRNDLTTVKLAWSSGLMLAVRIARDSGL